MTSEEYLQECKSKEQEVLEFQIWIAKKHTTRKTDYNIGQLLKIIECTFHSYSKGTIVKVLYKDYHSYHVVNITETGKSVSFWWVKEHQVKKINEIDERVAELD